MILPWRSISVGTRRPFGTVRARASAQDKRADETEEQTLNGDPVNFVESKHFITHGTRVTVNQSGTSPNPERHSEQLNTSTYEFRHRTRVHLRQSRSALGRPDRIPGA